MFVIALRQSNIVHEDVISVIKSYISHTYLKSKDNVFLWKKVSLNFLFRKPEDRSSRQGKFKLEKLGQKRNNYLVSAKNSTTKPIEPHWYENHWMLFDDNVVYKRKTYNTYQFLKTLIEEGIQKPITTNDSGLIDFNVRYILRLLLI